MNTRKWNPFKFLRGAGRRSDAQSPEGRSKSEQWHSSWPDISRFLSREPWRAVEEFIHDPF
ncbi:Hsp20/alpha crystallin family protein, partial [Paraburkholderia sp. UYCP14C]